jgi:hypothetical protein
MELLALLLQRKVIIALALVGAAIAVVGSVLLKKGGAVDPRLARFVLRFGYGVTWASVALFIAAGFFGS